MPGKLDTRLFTAQNVGVPSLVQILPSVEDENRLDRAGYFFMEIVHNDEKTGKQKNVGWNETDYFSKNKVKKHQNKKN